MTDCYNRLRLTVLALILLAGTSWAEEANRLFDMSLQELATVEVSVASQKAERIIDAPAVTSSYLIADMTKLGLSSLEEVLGFIPGVVVQDSAIGTKAVMIRGIVEAFNQKVLFLLDGVPYWQASHGGIPLLGLGLEYIEKIEVIRGPGAVFYGSNASSGVINIITRSDQRNSVALQLDTLNGQNIAAYTQTQYQSTQFKLGFHINDSGSYQAQFDNRPIPAFYPNDTPADTLINKKQKSHSFWLKATSEQWQTSLHHFSSENGGLASAASTLNESVFEYTGTLLSGQFEQDFSFGQARFFADFNNFYLTIPTKNIVQLGEDATQKFENQGNNNNRARIGQHLTTQVSDSLVWMNGVEYEYRSTGQYNVVNNQGNIASTSMLAQDVAEWSYFTQVDKQWQWGRILAGFRYVNNETAGDEFLPRLSIVKSLSDDQTVKLLYSTAFNTPSFIQQYINIAPDVLKGDENLSADVITTYELVYSMQRTRHLFVANYYYLQADDFIYRTITSPSQAIYANSPEFHRDGIDLDYRFIVEDTQWFANAAYIFQGDQTVNNDPTAKVTPKLTTALGVSHDIDKHFNAGTSLHYISARDSARELTIVRAQASYSFNNFRLRAYADNLLGEPMLHPDMQNFQGNQLVQNASKHPEFMLEASYRF
ncbi:TonB-dependent receptor plug domain-containing protein [Bermanella sp. R86510]|uniref:TonB-dependent receptor plug domain-containing protein n=1 Tax=unclassified Bermanella TaxID=2627862 RepID=UPI0037CA94B6